MAGYLMLCCIKACETVTLTHKKNSVLLVIIISAGVWAAGRDRTYLLPDYVESLESGLIKGRMDHATDR